MPVLFQLGPIIQVLPLHAQSTKSRNSENAGPVWQRCVAPSLPFSGEPPPLPVCVAPPALPNFLLAAAQFLDRSGSFVGSDWTWIVEFDWRWIVGLAAASTVSSSVSPTTALYSVVI